MRKFALAVLAALGLATSANAITVTIGTDEGLVRPGMDNQGWWRATTTNNNATNDNYVARPSDDIRNYFTFDLSGLSGVVTAASLQVRRYFTDEGATITFYDVSTSASDLAQRNVVNTSIHTDLGTGNAYGTFVAGAGTSTDLLTFDLNAVALTDIASSFGGYFSLGGRTTSGVWFGGSRFEPGNGGPGFIQQLVLEIDPISDVPAPAAIGLLGLGVAFVGLRRRNR